MPVIEVSHYFYAGTIVDKWNETNNCKFVVFNIVGKVVGGGVVVVVSKGVVGV